MDYPYVADYVKHYSYKAPKKGKTANFSYAQIKTVNCVTITEQDVDI